MRFPTFPTLFFGMALLPSTPVHAQTALPPNDVSLSLGWAGADYEHVPEYDRWSGSLQLGLSVGHYWTEHVKTEIGAAWNSPTSNTSYEDLVVGGTRTYAMTTYRAADAQLSVGQVYQFGRNAWVHPYLGAGADLVRRHSRMERPAQTRQAFVGTNQRPIDVTIPGAQETDTRALVRPFVKGGWKMYASDRLYFTTELKLGLAPDLDHALWTIGMGFDF